MQATGYCQCGCGELAPIAPRNHAKYGWVKGEPKRFLNGHGRRRTPHDYEVDANGCWIWVRALTELGYGTTSVKIARGVHRTRKAHIVYWERAHGPVPEGLELDHLCRVPACVNPEHLEPVTHAENIRRGNSTKLTADQVREIRASTANSRVIAARFGIARHTVHGLRRGRNWLGI